MRLASLGLVTGALTQLVAAVPNVLARDAVTTTTTTTQTAATTTTLTSSTTQVTTTTTTTTATEVDHTTVTDHTTITAYVIATLPPCAASESIEALTTIGGNFAPSVSVQTSTSTFSTYKAVGSSSPSLSSSYTSSNSFAPSTATSTAATSSSSASTPVLVPVVPSTGTGNLNNLNPGNSSTITYQQNGTTLDTTTPYYFAVANVTYRYPTVILPFSSLIYSINCTATGIEVEFNNTAAYNFAKSNWPSNGEDFVLITDSLDRNAAENAIHVYWLVTVLQFIDSSLAVLVTAQEIAFEDAHNTVSVVWGQVTPTGSNNTSTGSSWTTSNSTSASTNSTSTTGAPGTSTSSQAYNCSNPPQTVFGLPTAPCGVDFDLEIDALLGYWNVSDPAFLDSFVPGNDDGGLLEQLFDRRRSHVQKRGLGKLLKKLSKSIKKAAETVVAVVAPVVNTVATTVVATEQTAVAAVESVISALESPSWSESFSLGVTPSGEVSSVFGSDSYLMISESGTIGKVDYSVEAYCVGCGFSGTTKVGGVASYSIIPPKITEAEIYVDTTLTAGLNLGVVATAEYSQTVEKTILTLPIPEAGVAIPGILTLGCIVTMGVSASVDIVASGQLLVGGSLSIPEFRATFDMASGSHNIGSVVPTFAHTLQAEGEISASVSVGVPLELSLGLTIPAISFDADVGFRDTPSVSAQATFEAGNAGGSCNNGVSVDISFGNEIDFDFGGDLINLYSVTQPLYDNCFQFRKRDEIFARANITDTVVSNTTTSSSMSSSATSSLPTSASASLSTISSMSTTTSLSSSLATSSSASSLLNSTATLSSEAPIISSLIANLSSVLNQTIIDELTNLTSSADFNYTFINLYYSDDALVLGKNTEMNFILANATAGEFLFFATDDEVVLGSGGEDLFFYYPAEMNATGVSRLRTGGRDGLPISSSMVGLVPIDQDNDPSTPGIYIAMDTNLSHFFMAFVTIDNVGTKVFLVNDTSTACTTLMSSELQSIITGGVVSNCFLLALHSDAAGYNINSASASS